MAFLPSENNLDSVDELESLLFTITYRDNNGNFVPVEIEGINKNETVLITDNQISGYFSNVFETEIYYRTIFDDSTLDELKMVKYFDGLPKDQEYRIYHCNVDTTPFKIFEFIASSNGEAKQYTITVNNNWTAVRDKLKLYLSPEEIAGIKWINTSGNIITWKNSSGNTVIWNN